ncbi:MAG: hypothetical protein J6C26_02775 [Clostridia bacterium]|nr:hypothetical protein [Clostridia bacterium]
MDLNVSSVPKLILATDQFQERAVVYDLARYEEGKTLDDLEVWSLPIGHAAGLKFRENTVFGDVIIVGGSHSAIYEYPSGRKIWGTDNSGNNTHSVELLPSGNIVFTNTHGHCLRLFLTSALLEGNEAKAQEYLEYPKNWAYSAVWDPERKVLWAGGSRLEAYAVEGEGTNQTLRLLEDRGYTYPAHDMMPDYTDSRYLYMAGNEVVRYDKQTNTISDQFSFCDVLQGGSLKCFFNVPCGDFYCNGTLGGKGRFYEGFRKESWLTDTIVCFFRKIDENGTVCLVRRELTSSKSAFYKVRPLYGKYL